MRVVLAGGGTGGHLFPGIALAERLSPGSAHFLCTPRRFDSDQLAARAFSFQPMGRWSIRAALRELRRFRADVVLGLGGGGSLPGLAAARLRGLPTACLEQNVLPGRLNRTVGRFTRRFYSQWNEARRYLPGMNGRFVWSGSPLRRMARRPQGEARARYGLSGDRFTLLVLGGSQGAETLNRRVPAAVRGLTVPLQFLHLTGRGERCPEVRKAYRAAGRDATVLGFEADMDWAYSAADAAVSRAGALAMAELIHFRIPTLFIPFPGAVDDHQALNASVLRRAGAAEMVREEGFTEDRFCDWVSQVSDPTAVGEGQRQALAGFDRPGAAEEILQDVRERILR